MPNEKTDSLGFSTENPDMQRDMAAKGGPTTTLGKANDKHVAPTPATSDTQTEITSDTNDNSDSSKETKQSS